jgi:hypothetical protein
MIFAARLPLAVAATLLLTPPAFGQATGVIEMPIVEVARVNTSISAPAAAVVIPPPMPTVEPTRGYILERREIERDVRRIRAQHLGSRRFEPGRQRGLELLEEFTDSIAVEPLVNVLRRDQDDARQWLMEHLATRLDRSAGQATLSWLAIYDKDDWMRENALKHLAAPADERTKRLVLSGLRHEHQGVVSNAAHAANVLRLAEAIPLLIAAQPGTPESRRRGSMAWIFIGKQRYYVADITPVVGTASVGFDPTIGVINEGAVVVIRDGVVHFYNMDAHHALVNIVEHHHGQRVDFGFDRRRWEKWYDNEFRPMREGRPPVEGP